MNLIPCDLKSSADTIKVKRKLAPEVEESEEEHDSDSGESKVERPPPVPKADINDGYNSLVGAKRCAACVKGDYSACKVNMVGFRKLEGWARGIVKVDALPIMLVLGAPRTRNLFVICAPRTRNLFVI